LLALTKPAVAPVPQPGETVPRTIHYVSDVQPVLDRHCVRCHGGGKPASGLDLSGALTQFFNRSYENIMKRNLLSYITEFYGPRGKIGVEKSHEDELRGTPGAKIIEANAYGRPLRELDYRQGAPGLNLILTLDAKVQMAAESGLGELDGAVVAIDPRNGEVIALVSKPGFDPQPFVAGIDQRTYKALLDDRKRPLYNRALQGAYPPGSTIKPFMALAGLEYDTLEAAHGEFCRGEMSLPHSTRKYRCWKRTGHGWLDMAGGVRQSCDIYFYEVAQALGVDRIHSFLGLFGLGRVTAIDLPLEKSGLLPSREWKMRTRKEAWYPGETPPDACS
jgi:penicillin-binding protein 2